MSIMPSSKASKPKLPYTFSVAVNDEVYLPDEIGAGRAIKRIRNDDTDTSDILTLSINCMTMTGKPNNGLVDTQVRIFNADDGGTLELAGQETSPEGMKIVSFKVVSSDAGTVNITVW